MPDQTYDPFGHVGGLERLNQTKAQFELNRYHSSCLPQELGELLVGHLVPPGFEAYCRILPPLQVDLPERWRPWSRLLEPAGLNTDPGSFVRALHNRFPDGGLREMGIEPLVGELDQQTAGRLLEALSAWTSSEVNCLFYFWIGRNIGAQERHGATRQSLRLKGEAPAGGQEHMLYGGPLALLTQFVTRENGHTSFFSPTAFWPEQMTWLFAMHTDAVAAYLGGPQDLVNRIVHHRSLEAALVSVGTKVDDWTDWLPE